MNKLFLALLFALVATTSDSQTKGDNVSFKKVHITDEFIGEGCSIADVNNDGLPDIVAGARWFEAPDWKTHEIWSNKKFDYAKGYSDSFLTYTMDVNEDGWVDVISFGWPGKEVCWFENPANARTTWKRLLIDSIASNESPMAADVDADGKMDLIFGNEKTEQMSWWHHSVKNKKVTWTRMAISEKGAKGVGKYSHGLGHGDINGDGLKDIIITSGWWEAPKPITGTPWRFHETSIGLACSQMLVSDVDKDGDADVITGSAHDFGVWWHEQVSGKSNEPVFITHLIDSSFSEAHSMVLRDVNNDGSPDVITGKRFFAHLGEGPGGMMAPVLYWFELRHDGSGKPVWVRHMIDERSGVGCVFEAKDMTSDGLLDFAIANKNGVFYFEQIPATK